MDAKPAFVIRPGWFVVMPWPTYPTVTAKTGKPSKSKKAGQRLPWLSMNVVNNLPRPVHHQLRGLWRDASAKAANQAEAVGLDVPARLRIRLFKATTHRMDFGAVVEGSKPIIDGLVKAGIFLDDDPDYIRGIDVLPSVAVGLKGQTRIEVSWEAA